MQTVEKSIDVDVPVNTAYDQWTQFETFPSFMDGIESVEQYDDTHLHWRANVNGQVKEWNAEITEQKPDDRVAWTSTGGAPNGGVVTFHRLDDNSCRVMLQLEYEPEGAMESLGDMLGTVSRQVESDLENFKNFIERQGVATGSWRGSVGGPVSTMADSTPPDVSRGIDASPAASDAPEPDHDEVDQEPSPASSVDSPA